MNRMVKVGLYVFLGLVLTAGLMPGLSWAQRGFHGHGFQKARSGATSFSSEQRWQHEKTYRLARGDCDGSGGGAGGAGDGAGNGGAGGGHGYGSGNDTGHSGPMDGTGSKNMHLYRGQEQHTYTTTEEVQTPQQ